MSLKDLEPGNYRANPVRWGFVEKKTKEGESFFMAAVVFNLLDVNEEITWEEFIIAKSTGELNAKLMKGLKACAFKADDIASLTDEDALDSEKEVELTIEREGNFLKVKWVNEPGQGRVTSFMEANEAHKRIKALLKSAKPTAAPKAEPAKKPAASKSNGRGMPFPSVEADDFDL